MNLTNKIQKSIIIFLETDHFYECNIINNLHNNTNIFSTLFNNNILINSNIKSFSINYCDHHNLHNCDIYYIKNIIEYLINKLGIYSILHDDKINIYSESYLKKKYIIIPNLYKLLTTNLSSIEKYYIKQTNHISMLQTLFQICQKYDIQFSIQIELQNYSYRRINILLDHI
jgi:hypothetical protein